MKNKITFILIGTIALLQSCSKQDYYNIPRDANGNVIITTVASTTNTGITTLDNSFTVNAVLPNAKAGDVMIVELLAQQVPKAGGATQMLPIDGTQQSITVSADFKVSATYTRSQAMMTKAGDVVAVTFAGKTESALIKAITMVSATSVAGPKYNSNKVTLIRSAGTAYFDVAVAPKAAAYTGNVVVKSKNGVNDAWQTLAGPYTGAASKVYISGADFAVGKDTMYYMFVSTLGAFIDTVKQTVVANAPYFQLTKSGTMTLGASSGGVNTLTNATVAADNAMGIMAIDGSSLTIHAGSVWGAVAGNTLNFVPITVDVYNANNSDAAITAYAAGTTQATVDPNATTSIYVFQIVTGGTTYYGMLKTGGLVPGVSVTYEYKIGNMYAQFAVLE